MIELFNNLTFVKFSNFIFIMLSVYFYYKYNKAKMFLSESVLTNERLDEECDKLHASVKAHKSSIVLLDESLGKEQHDNTQLRIVISNLNAENAELTALVAKANVAAMPVRKPRRPRNRKPQPTNGQT